jgi:hypothetical protein
MGHWGTLKIQTSQASLLMPVIPAIQDTEIGKIMVRGQHRQKKRLTGSYFNQYACGSARLCMGDVNWKMEFQADLGKNTRHDLKND